LGQRVDLGFAGVHDILKRRQKLCLIQLIKKRAYKNLKSMNHKSLLSQHDTIQLPSSRKDPQPRLTLNFIDNYKEGETLVMENSSISFFPKLPHGEQGKGRQSFAFRR
jgi:hypothetical protein